MSHILVVYASRFGNTERMASSLAEGANSVDGCQALLRKAADATREDARACDGLIIGSPMRHRSMDSQVKRFIEDVLEVLWLGDEMVGKVGGVFTVGGGYGDCGAGVEIAQLGILAALAASGLLLVPMPKTTPGSTVAGSHWGPHGRSGGPGMEPNGISKEMLEAAHHHGAAVARVSKAMHGVKWQAEGNRVPSLELQRLFSGEGM